MVMTDGFNMPVPQLLLLTGDLKIQRTRRVLLIILGILLAPSLVSTITVIYGNRIGDGIKKTHGGMQFGQSLISVLFYGFGIFVAYRYYETGLRMAISEQNIDFEVNFNPTVSVNSLNQNAATASELSTIVCNINSQTSAPSASNLVVYGNQIDTLAGVSVDGVSIMNVNSLNDVDPFYPTGTIAAESVDACLGHPNPQNTYHYHMASGCALSPPSGTISSCTATSSCNSNVAAYGISLFNSYRTLTVIGIAKDGHVIYGPYDSTGTEVRKNDINFIIH
ncbi:unnamed protein product [Rotaria sp. Silwood1]|nr:unnamed protein product [Rotaria sp. Silwood1]